MIQTNNYSPLNEYGYDNESKLKPINYVIGITDDEKMLTITDGKLKTIVKLDENNGLLSLLGVDGEVLTSVELPNAQFIKEAYFDSNTNEIVIIIELSDGSLKEVRFSLDLSKYSTKEYTDNSKMEAINSATNNAATLSNQAKESAIIDSTAIATTLSNQAKIDAITTSTNSAIELINTTKQDVITIASLDASTKSAKAFNDANNLLNVETNRAVRVENLLRTEVNAKVSNVELVTDIANNMRYTLVVDGFERGEINIPVNQFLKSADYDVANKKLVFVFNTESGHTTTELDVADLVDTYTASNGIVETNNNFSIQLDPSTQSYLTVGVNGIKVSGITESIELVKTNLTNNINTLKVELDNEVLRAQTVENSNKTSLDTYKVDNKTYVDDELLKKQNTLISGTNIKSINNESLLGGGNITIKNQHTIGDVKMSLVSSNHDGWLKCDGSSISRTTYADLFAIIGVSFGNGDGTNTFNLPNMMGKTAISPSADRAMGLSVGADGHNISKANLPNYDLTINNKAAQTITTTSDGNHTHSQSNDALRRTSTTVSDWASAKMAIPICRNVRSVNRDGEYDNIYLYNDGGSIDNQTDVDWLQWELVSNITIANNGSHSHTVTIPADSYVVNSGGGNSAISNFQPSVFLGYYYIYGGII